MSATKGEGTTSIVDKRTSSPTDVYNYAINGNSYYSKPSTSGLSKKSTKANDASDAALRLDKKIIKLTDFLINAENNKQTIYPFAVLVLAAIPVLLVLCTSAIGFYTKTLVMIIYLLMIALTVYLFKK